MCSLPHKVITHLPGLKGGAVRYHICLIYSCVCSTHHSICHAVGDFHLFTLSLSVIYILIRINIRVPLRVKKGRSHEVTWKTWGLCADTQEQSWYLIKGILLFSFYYNKRNIIILKYHWKTRNRVTSMPLQTQVVLERPI